MVTGPSFSGQSPFTVIAFTNLNKGQTIDINGNRYKVKLLKTWANIDGEKCNIYDASVSDTSSQMSPTLSNS